MYGYCREKFYVNHFWELKGKGGHSKTIFEDDEGSEYAQWKR